MEAKLKWNIVKNGKNGFPESIQSEVEVYVDEKEIVRNEFYEAMRSGISVKKVLVLRTEDFELSKHLDENGKMEYATKIEYENETFNIIRAYKRGKSKIELTCGE